MASGGKALPAPRADGPAAGLFGAPGPRPGGNALMAPVGGLMKPAPSAGG